MYIIKKGRKIVSKKVPKKTPISKLPKEQRNIIRNKRKEKVNNNKRMQVHNCIMKGQFGPKARFKFNAKGYVYTKEEIEAIAKIDVERYEKHLKKIDESRSPEHSCGIKIVKIEDLKTTKSK